MTGDEIAQILSLDTQREQLLRQAVTGAIQAQGLQAEIDYTRERTATERALRIPNVEQTAARTENIQANTGLTREEITELQAFRDPKLDALLASTAGQRLINDARRQDIQEIAKFSDLKYTALEADISYREALAQLASLEESHQRVLLSYLPKEKEAVLRQAAANALAIETEVRHSKQFQQGKLDFLDQQIRQLRSTNDIQDSNKADLLEKVKLGNRLTEAQIKGFETELSEFVEITTPQGTKGKMRLRDVYSQIAENANARAAALRAERDDARLEGASQRQIEEAVEEARLQLESPLSGDNTIYNKRSFQRIFNKYSQDPFVFFERGSEGWFRDNRDMYKHRLPIIRPELKSNFGGLEGQMQARHAQAMADAMGISMEDFVKRIGLVIQNLEKEKGLK